MEDIFVTFIDTLNTTLVGAVDAMFSALSSQAAPFLALLIATAFIFYVIQWAAKGTFDVMGWIYFVVRSSIIYSLVAGGLYWSSYLYPFISGFGNEVGVTLYNSFGGTTISTGDDFTSILAGYYSQVANASSDLVGEIEEAMFLSAAEFKGAVATIFTTFFTMVMIAIGFTILTITKVFLLLFIAIAPLFLVWAYLGATKSIFDGWISGITRAILTQVLVFAVLGFFMAAADTVMAATEVKLATLGSVSDADSYLVSQLWQLTFVSMIGIMMLFAVPSMATGLAGGAISVGATTIQYAQGSIQKGAGLAGRGAAAGGAAAGRATRDGVARMRGQGGSAESAANDAGGSRRAAMSAADKNTVQKMIDRVRNAK